MLLYMYDKCAFTNEPGTTEQNTKSTLQTQGQNVILWQVHERISGESLNADKRGQDSFTKNEG
jgi:hypothetical protein